MLNTPAARLIAAIVASFVVSLVLGRILIPVLRALKAGQSIREDGPTWHNSKAGTPTMGGLSFIGASVLSLVFGIQGMMSGDFTALYVLLLSLCFGLVGFLDDFFKVKYKRNLGLTSIQKACLQMAVSAIFLYILYKEGIMSASLYIPFTKVYIELHPLLYIFFAMFVIVGCVNAVNLTDGIDGLSSSVTLPVMVFFTLCAMTMGKFDLALLPGSLVGGLAAFLIYNWKPAKMFMGDTGSLFLGGAVCGLAFALDMPLVLIFVGIIYITETLSVILQVGYFKLTHGKRLFKMAPIHHHFEKCGWSEERIVITFASITIAMCLLAWLGVTNHIG
ncbi:MAG: phospho-N-acetylmuramoyl-pentapeptide-transferase [Oscillospiraceae bacterium]|nr:phospho-N-acetylmuramoyl-pentapeptide-transferase [Oscillospiraceae bacterium]